MMKTIDGLRLYNLEEISPAHPARIFYEYWKQNKSETGYFPRRIFNPMKFPAILPWMVIFEKIPLDKGEDRQQECLNDRDYRFKYRLCGSEYVRFVGQDLTGGFLGRLQIPEEAVRSYDTLEHCLKHNIALATIVDFPMEGRDFTRVVRAAYPVSSDGNKLDQIFLVVAPETKNVSLPSWYND